MRSVHKYYISILGKPREQNLLHITLAKVPELEFINRFLILIFWNPQIFMSLDGILRFHFYKKTSIDKYFCSPPAPIYSKILIFRVAHGEKVHITLSTLKICIKNCKSVNRTSENLGKSCLV
jgi:hypothetical protein